MNDLATIPRSFGLVPANMTEAMRLAEMMANARLVPKDLQKSPADCLMVIQQAMRWQMDAFAVAQECSVVQGKLMHSGKLVAAVINVNGNLAERLCFSYEGEGDGRSITVAGRFQGEAQRREITVHLKDAKTTNRMWQIQPDQQLMYHGSRVWARRHAPELMLGVNSPEEFDAPTIIDVTPKKLAPSAASAFSAPAATVAAAADDIEHDADGVVTGEDLKTMLKASYIDTVYKRIADETNSRTLAKYWNEQKTAREDFEFTKDEVRPLKEACIARLNELGSVT